MKYNLIALRARSFVALLLVATFFAGLLALYQHPTAVSAQEEAPAVESTQLSCNDVRGMEGLSLNVPQQEDVVTEPGASFTVPVTIDNGYMYELRDLSLGAVVFFNGNAVPYDWFNVTTDLDISAEGSKTVDVTWTVPHNAPKGSYEFVVYLHQGDSEHLLTSALSRSSMSSSLDFSVGGDAEAAAQFDISSIKVNGKAMTAGAVNTYPADAEHLDFTIDIVNEFEDVPQIGPVTLTVYESFYPHSISALESETFEARLLSGSRYTYALDFSPNFDQYIVTGQFKAEDGSQSSFLVLLQREGATGTITQPLPTVSFIGVSPKGEGEAEVIGCIENNESALLTEDELAPGYPVDYRMTVHPIDEAGEPIRSDLLATAEGSAELGGGVSNFGFSKTFTRADEFMVRVDVLKDGEVVDVREVRYQCDPDFGCALSPEHFGGSDNRTIFGIGVGALILGMQLATLAILLTVMSIFFCNIYPLVMRRRKSPTEGGGTGA